MVRSVRDPILYIKRYVMKVSMDRHALWYQRIAKRCPSCNIKRTSRRQVHFGLIHKKKVLDAEYL